MESREWLISQLRFLLARRDCRIIEFVISIEPLMTYRLTSLASCGEAESIFADMLVEITHDDDDVLGDVPAEV